MDPSIHASIEQNDVLCTHHSVGKLSGYFVVRALGLFHILLCNTEPTVVSLFWDDVGASCLQWWESPCHIGHCQSYSQWTHRVLLAHELASRCYGTSSVSARFSAPEHTLHSGEARARAHPNSLMMFVDRGGCVVRVDNRRALVLFCNDNLSGCTWWRALPVPTVVVCCCCEHVCHSVSRCACQMHARLSLIQSESCQDDLSLLSLTGPLRRLFLSTLAASFEQLHSASARNDRSVDRRVVYGADDRVDEGGAPGAFTGVGKSTVMLVGHSLLLALRQHHSCINPSSS